MDAIKVLIQDHEEIKQYFREFEQAGERAYKKKHSIAEKVIEELHAHTQIEERLFYPAVMEKGGKELKELVLEGIEEHRAADFMIERLRTTPPEDETFDAKFKVLIEVVEHHLKEEEKEMFPEARKALKDELEPLGAQMEAMHKRIEG